MRIAIDISQVTYEGTGVARYTKNLIKAILQYDKSNDYVFFYSSLRRGLDEILAAKIREKHLLKIFPFPPTLLDMVWNKLHIMPINQLIGDCDIFVSSDWTQPPLNSKTKKITIVHDLVYLKYPETLHPKIVAVQKRRMKWVKKECDLIIADSESTKHDLIKLLDIDQNKIRVVYPSVEISQPTSADIDQVAKKYGIDNKKYILTVGKLEPRKNISRLISAFKKASLDGIQLLIVGPKGWEGSDSPEMLKQNPRGWRDQPSIQFLGFVPDTDLYALYANAEFFIYPSLYEGFGYPIVEAMSLGCPVATSNSSSMKEIADGYGSIFDPNSVKEISATIKKLHSDMDLRKNLIEKGRKRASEFNMKKFAQTFIYILKNLC